MELLQETIENFERDIGLSMKEMESMDLCNIERHIGYNPEKHYKRRVLTLGKHERNVQRLLKKYL